MEKKDSGLRDINPIRLLAGILLLYFAWQLLSGLLNGEASNIFLSVCGTVVFALCGVGLLGWELHMHRQFLGKDKKSREAGAQPLTESLPESEPEAETEPEAEPETETESESEPEAETETVSGAEKPAGEDIPGKNPQA